MILKKIFLGIVVVCLLIISASIAYHFTVYLPQTLKYKNDQLKYESDQLKFKADQKTSLEKCVKETEDLYTYDWNGNCHLRNRKDQCTLEPDLAIIINQRRDDLKKECLKKYPQ